MNNTLPPMLETPETPIILKIAEHVLDPKNTTRILQQYIHLGQELEKIQQEIRRLESLKHNGKTHEETMLDRRYTSIAYRQLFPWQPGTDEDTSDEYDKDVTCIALLVNKFNNGELTNEEMLIEAAKNLFDINFPVESKGHQKQESGTFSTTRTEKTSPVETLDTDILNIQATTLIHINDPHTPSISNAKPRRRLKRKAS
jgi:hypothetical protein